MIRLPLFQINAFASCLLLAASASCQTTKTPSREIDQQFQSAVAAYHAGNFADAATQLESLLPKAPNSFEAHELLGLIYAAQSKNAKSVEQLQIAVRLHPDAAAARTNLAAALSKTGDIPRAGLELHKAFELDPKQYQTNHNLAEYYLQSKKIADAIPFLEEAQKINPTAYDNGYDLALAYFLTGKNNDATIVLETLIAQKNTGELHNLLGQIDEKEGKFVEAANQFETAAQLDPTEDNLFAWASELLLHRTYKPAIEVFQQASVRYPKSPRLLIGLGMAQYSLGMYQDSVKSLLAASDLTPNDARCYLFLSKAYLSSPDQAEDVIQRFRRYAELQPRNARAQYYYAMSLWKGKRSEAAGPDFDKVETLLRTSIKLDGKMADPHLQLGILYANQHQYAKSLPEYTRALQLDPDSPDVHFRLAEYYVHAGQKEHAKEEFAVYEKLNAQYHAAIDKEKAEVKQFVVSEQADPSTNH